MSLPPLTITFTSQAFRTSILAGFLLVYSFLFLFLFETLGAIMAVLSLWPVGVAGWLWGRTGGALMGVGVIPLNALLLFMMGQRGLHVLGVQWPLMPLCIAVGIVTGYGS